MGYGIFMDFAFVSSLLLGVQRGLAWVMLIRLYLNENSPRLSVQTSRFIEEHIFQQISISANVAAQVLGSCPALRGPLSILMVTKGLHEY